MANFYQVKKTIGGVEYTAQFNGISAALDATDSCYINGTSNTSNKKLAKYLFEHVIVSPKTEIDDFENIDDFNEVVMWASDVMQGKCKPSLAEKATAKSK